MNVVELAPSGVHGTSAAPTPGTTGDPGGRATVAPLRVVIVDDDPIIRLSLEFEVNAAPDLSLAGVAGDGEAGLALVRELRPDIVLLDINMPLMNGLELARILSDETGPAVIFVTGSTAFAHPAFGLAAAYLLKPVSSLCLQDAVALARRRIRQSAAEVRASALEALVEALRAEPAAPAVDAAIWVSGPRGRQRLPIAGVDWFEAQRDYVSIHAGERTFIQRGTLRDLAGKLDASVFVRVHRSAIVNLNAVTGIERRGRGQFAVRLSTGVDVAVGRSFLSGLRASVERSGVVQIRG